MAACGGKHLRLLFGSAPLAHDMWEQIFFIITIWDVVTEMVQEEEEENSPFDHDKPP